MLRRLVVSPHADRRLDAAREWLGARAADEELRVVAAHADAAADLLRSACETRGAVFGWQRTSLPRLAAELAALSLAELARVPVGALAAEAVMARVIHRRAERDELGRFASAGNGPGLARALARAIEEVRAAKIPVEALRHTAPELAGLLEDYDAALADAGLADRALVETLAAERVLAGGAELERPLLLVDLPAPSATQRALLAALIEASPDCLATLPAGDVRARTTFEAMLDLRAEERVDDAAPDALRALQRHLFEESAPSPSPPDPAVALLSAPGESRECVEIARRIQDAAREGIAFDRIAIWLHAPEAYGPFLREALRRAGVPAHFARGTRHPDPSGRALVALLACAAEGLSARRFAEYLSLGEVPSRTSRGDPPPAPPSGERWVPPDEELVAERLRAQLVDEGEDADARDESDAASDRGPSAPRRWERLLVDAAVIGGRERWNRRLLGLASELESDIAALDDPEGPLAERLARDAADLEGLRDFAMPLIDALDALPAAATWGEWIDALSELASRALRRPQRALAVLAELAPMAAVGPVGLREVQIVLAPRLQQLASPPSGARYGKVFVGPTDAARGLEFDRVFVPGLAEKLFPRKIGEEPILLDAQRTRLDAGLATNAERLEAERLALRLALGSARSQAVLSYPRLDVDGARPRVPSFYALEALRAAEGTLPGFDALARRAETLGGARLGWPAPDRPESAIDAAEFDLATLQQLDSREESRRDGAARYLLDANPHLARALRFRARRWLQHWKNPDGFVDPSEAGRNALAPHRLEARSFSPTALQNYATCPYKFYLYAVCRLSPREEPEAIEEMDPLQRGSLVHDVQFELLSELREAELLPLTPERLPAAWDLLDAALSKVAKHYADLLAPAIERVWRDGVQAVRADLREWLSRASRDDSGYVPHRFELAFGLPGRRDADPASRPDAVEVEGGLRLRGSIDLVERHPDGRVRVTDHKTGKQRFGKSAVIDGGRALQPVLYALVAERLFPDAPIESGRLYYCTSVGEFAEREVALDDAARESARALAQTVGEALDEPFLPAAPEKGACRWCDYRPVCGPYEEMRSARKSRARLAGLDALRGRP